MFPTDPEVCPPKGKIMTRSSAANFLLGLALCALVFVHSSCRSTFQSVKATPPKVSDQDLTVPTEDPETQNPAPTPTPTKKDPYTILERSRTLSPQESVDRGCRGIITIFEKGPDINRDNILQSNEINETRSECQVKPTTNDCDSSSQTQNRPGCQTQSQQGQYSAPRK